MKKLLFLIMMLVQMSVCNARMQGNWQADWSASVRMAGGTGHYVPFWARTGEDGILPVRSSGLLAAGGVLSYAGDSGWNFEAGFNGVGVLSQKSIMNKGVAYGLVDRLYASAGWKMIHLDVGLKPRHGDLGPLSVTGGDMIMSGNARNLPGVNLSTDWVSFNKLKWFSFKANLAHYHMLDNRTVKGVMLHNKSLSVRFSFGSRVDLMGGLHHYAMWGGVSPILGPQGSTFSDYVKVFFASKGDEDDMLMDQLNAFGNHLGTEWVRVAWRADRFTMIFQYDKLFEDNSGKNFKNLRRELPSLEIEISLKLMELFKTFTNSVPEDHEHQQAPLRKKEYWKGFSKVRESLYDRLLVRLEFQNQLFIALCNVVIGKVIFQD